MNNQIPVNSRICVENSGYDTLLQKTLTRLTNERRMCLSTTLFEEIFHKEYLYV